RPGEPGSACWRAPRRVWRRRRSWPWSCWGPGFRGAAGRRPLGPLELLAVAEVAQLLAAVGMPELGQGLRLDLADPLPGDPELPPDLLERARLPVLEAEAEADDLLLPLVELLEGGEHRLVEHPARRDLGRRIGLEVLDEVAEVGVVLLAHRRVERERVERDAEDLPDPLGSHVDLGGQLLDGGLPLQLLE